MSEDVLDGFAATESATKMAQRAFNKGVQYFHDSNWFKAVECYNESLTYDDAFFSALCWRGCAYHHLGQFENVTSPSPRTCFSRTVLTGVGQVIVDFCTTLRLNPEFVDGKENLRSSTSSPRPPGCPAAAAARCPSHSKSPCEHRSVHPQPSCTRAPSSLDPNASANDRILPTGTRKNGVGAMAGSR